MTVEALAVLLRFWPNIGHEAVEPSAPASGAVPTTNAVASPNTAAAAVACRRGLRGLTRTLISYRGSRKGVDGEALAGPATDECERRMTLCELHRPADYAGVQVVELQDLQLRADAAITPPSPARSPPGATALAMSPWTSYRSKLDLALRRPQQTNVVDTKGSARWS